MGSSNAQKKFSTWADAFKFASSVELEDLGTDFNPPDDSEGGGNLGAVSEIAKDFLLTSSNKKRKYEDGSDVIEGDINHNGGCSSLCHQSKKRDKRSKKMLKKEKEKKVKKVKKVKKKEDKFTDEPERNNNKSKTESTSVQTEGQKMNHTGDDSSDRAMKSNLGRHKKDIAFPYPTDPDDHCESPMESYHDIVPILSHLTKLKNNFIIYDPYYCNGLVKEYLADLGFKKVYHEKEDAYKTWDEKNLTQPYPKYDLFLTNPPYSADHIERLLVHLTCDKRSAGKPWCLLMPSFVHKKDYFKKMLSNGIKPFYLVPKKRYIYKPPKKFREKKESDVHKKSSPFVSMWYIWGGSYEKNESMIRAFQKSNKNSCDFARSPSALRDLRRKSKKKAI